MTHSMDSGSDLEHTTASPCTVTDGNADGNVQRKTNCTLVGSSVYIPGETYAVGTVKLPSSESESLSDNDFFHDKELFHSNQASAAKTPVKTSVIVDVESKRQRRRNLLCVVLLPLVALILLCGGCAGLYFALNGGDSDNPSGKSNSDGINTKSASNNNNSDDNINDGNVNDNNNASGNVVEDPKPHQQVENLNDIVEGLKAKLKTLKAEKEAENAQCRADAKSAAAALGKEEEKNKKLAEVSRRLDGAEKAQKLAERAAKEAKADKVLAEKRATEAENKYNGLIANIQSPSGSSTGTLDNGVAYRCKAVTCGRVTVRNTTVHKETLDFEPQAYGKCGNGTYISRSIETLELAKDVCRNINLKIHKGPEYYDAWQFPRNKKCTHVVTQNHGNTYQIAYCNNPNPKMDRRATNNFYYWYKAASKVKQTTVPEMYLPGSAAPVTPMCSNNQPAKCVGSTSLLSAQCDGATGKWKATNLSSITTQCSCPSSIHWY